ncbi:MAG TPA: hypothetical protein VF828_02105, partial [Patescibacteria group bacterium]
ISLTSKKNYLALTRIQKRGEGGAAIVSGRWLPSDWTEAGRQLRSNRAKMKRIERGNRTGMNEMPQTRQEKNFGDEAWKDQENFNAENGIA